MAKAKAKAKKKNLASDGVMTVIIIASALQFARTEEEERRRNGSRRGWARVRIWRQGHGYKVDITSRTAGDSQVSPLEIEKGREIDVRNKTKGMEYRFKFAARTSNL